MDLIGSLTDENNVRGITLNSQNIDLFNIIEQSKSREEAMQKKEEEEISSEELKREIEKWKMN